MIIVFIIFETSVMIFNIVRDFEFVYTNDFDSFLNFIAYVLEYTGGFTSVQAFSLLYLKKAKDPFSEIN